MHCDWDNFAFLVEQGQLDDLQKAAQQHFGPKKKTKCGELNANSEIHKKQSNKGGNNC
jgi:hypothetical protein